MAEKHFYEQKQYTKEYLLPYFQKLIPDFHKKKVLEVGCAEGGLLETLQDLGMHVVGVELSPERVKIAVKKNSNLNIFVGDITDSKLPEQLSETFDVIIIREVIEHVPDKKAAFNNLGKLLNDNGFLFISFPPKRSPFAGHQQIGKSFLKTIPYLHILPKSILKPVAKLLGEGAGYIDEIKLHYGTGCTVNEFEFQCLLQNFIPIKKDFFLFRPIYALRFGLPTIKLPRIPILKEYISLGCETLLQKKPF
ncbi:MAG: methyltransferase domain-containing protein [Ignavibacteriales bacterium]|nr:MAG: methyltransferase domain-containing protein [Ignavibacteriales bacterium]